MLEFAGIAILSVLAAGVAGVFLLLSWRLGPKRPNPVKDEPFETGVVPLALPAGRLSVKFYVVAMLFIVFDVELVFLFPWAVVARELGPAGLTEMGLFLLVIVAGLVYAWGKGALEWARSEDPRDVPHAPRRISR